MSMELCIKDFNYKKIFRNELVDIIIAGEFHLKAIFKHQINGKVIVEYDNRYLEFLPMYVYKANVA